MTYTPNRIVRKNYETEEDELDRPALQRNLMLIAKETDELGNKILANQRVTDTSEKVLKKQTRFVNAFLFN